MVEVTQADMREAVARALAKHDRIEICSDASYALSSYGPKADAALSLMQPEIDHRAAEERAKLLEALRVPSEGMIEAIARAISIPQHHTTWDLISDMEKSLFFMQAGYAVKAMLAQFEKENSHD